MKTLREMSSREIGEHLGFLIRSERKITNEILAAINLALERRAYLELGYPSMFEWLVKGFGYSHSAAYRRVESARMLRSVPEIATKLESGEVNLSTVGRAQTIIRAQEKATGQKVSMAEKAKVVAKIEGKSYQEAEQVLLALFPETAETIHQERRTVLNENTVRHAMNLPAETEANLRRVKEVLSHKFPNASDAQVIGYALNFLLEKIDPLRKSSKSVRAESSAMATQGAAESASKCVSRDLVGMGGTGSIAAVRRGVIQRAEARCTFKNERGAICNSRYQVQIDHIIPKALGGTDHPDNLRIRCRQHNMLEAERVFGRAKMDRFRKH